MSRKSEREAREKLARIHQKADDQNWSGMQGEMPHRGATTGGAATHRESVGRSVRDSIKFLRGK